MAHSDIEDEVPGRDGGSRIDSRTFCDEPTCCEAKQRDKLEKLCRYITRPAIANERLSTNERGQVIYRFKQPFRDGTTHVVLDPLDFIARLARPIREWT